jgi:ATP-dependent exoDNAse (exonuclease V) beta subunit
MDVMIVDDEPAARRTVRECCEREPDLRVIGEFGDPRSALPQPLLRRAALANAHGQCRREAAIVVRLKDETLVECIADLAFREADEWVVVDFKTDAELGTQEQRYRRQVALYVRGIAEATSAKTRGHLLLL